MYASGAIAIGIPGWPEFAAWTASMESVRTVSIARRSRSVAGGAVIRSVSPLAPRICVTRQFTTPPAARIASSARSPSPGLTSTARVPAVSTVTAKPSRRASSAVARTQ